MARIYRAAVDKGVLLTVIQDSCHSGSGARGSWNARGTLRALPRDGRYVEDPPDRDAAGDLLKSPEVKGALVLSASQEDQPAAEAITDSGPHGLFSFALFHALETSPPNERMDRLFQRMRAEMQSEGVLQEPVMAGAGRDVKSLLGLPADSANVVTAAVQSIEGSRVILQGGPVSGLFAGCELGHGTVRVRIDRVTGLNSSVARVIEGEANAITEGDLFRLDRWTAPEFADLRVFVPPALPLSTIANTVKNARDAARLAGIDLVADPTLHTPGAVMSWQGKSWILEQNRAGVQVDLSADPPASRLAQALRAIHARNLYLLLPPPDDWRLPFGPGAAYQAIVPVMDRADAQYVLYGRSVGEGLSYAWVLPNLTEAEVSESDPPLALPLRSEWILVNGDSTRRLTDSATSLARVRAWLRIPSPPADLGFPYRLALKEAASGNPVRAGELVEGLRFKLWLEATEPPNAVLDRRWVYVFMIDREGRGKLFFPPKGQGNVSNRLPLAIGTPPGSLPLTSDYLEVAAPFGADTYFLLVSGEALPHPEVLDFDAVYRSTRDALDNNPLGRLLGGVGSGTRGAREAVPTNWFLERQTFRSVPKPK